MLCLMKTEVVLKYGGNGWEFPFVQGLMKTEVALKLFFL